MLQSILIQGMPETRSFGSGDEKSAYLFTTIPLGGWPTLAPTIKIGRPIRN
jgi:hypothetical protein